MTTRYNVLFNGKEALGVGETILSEAFEDNFYALLPVEPINLRGENIDETTVVPGFDRAEEKAAKAIQKHSMRINNVQFNNQIDLAYLLLGKARYYDRRFFPALEAFNFLLENGAVRNVYVEGKIWREKTNIRLKNYELAINNLTPLVGLLRSSNPFYPLANATLADAFINIKELDSAVVYMKKAAIDAPKRKNKSRYLFITGQLFEQIEKIDSARWAYQEVIRLKRKAPRKFIVQAKIKENALSEAGTFEEKEQRLMRMLNNYENLPYEHQIYSALGKLYLAHNNDSLGLNAFDQSLKSEALDIYTEINNIQILNDYFFRKGDYVKTGTYLDKLLTLYEENTSEHKKTKRQRENLSEVIIYENTIAQTDSLLSLMALTRQKQMDYFEEYINNKRREEEEKLMQETEKKKGSFFGKSKTAFYFYNSNLLIQGKQAYLSQWGNRPNIDNWRNSGTFQTVLENNTTVGKVETNRPTVFFETPQQLYEALPKTKREKDSILTVNQKAYLQLGLIYKEKFKNTELARLRLEHLNSQNLPEDIAVQALYHLYRLEEGENPEVAEQYKTNLIARYPKSPFAQLLSDPENFSNSEIITPETLYANILTLFQEQSFSEVLDKMESMKVLSSGTSIEPKVELLRAHTLGRLQGIEKWKEALTEVAESYGGVEEGRSAKALLEQMETWNDLEEQGPVYKNYKWVFPIAINEWNPDAPKLLAFKERITETRPRWSISFDLYNETIMFIVVHGIRDPKEVELWLDQNKNEAFELMSKQNFVALASQYRTYLKNKNWNSSK